MFYFYLTLSTIGFILALFNDRLILTFLALILTILAFPALNGFAYVLAFIIYARLFEGE